METSTKVGKIELNVLDKGNTYRKDHNWITRKGHKCGYKNWDWDVKYPFAYWYYGQTMAWAMSQVANPNNGTDWMCWGCTSVGGVPCTD